MLEKHTHRHRTHTHTHTQRTQAYTTHTHTNTHTHAHTQTHTHTHTQRIITAIYLLEPTVHIIVMIIILLLYYYFYYYDHYFGRLASCVKSYSYKNVLRCMQTFFIILKSLNHLLSEISQNHKPLAPPPLLDFLLWDRHIY